MAKKIIFTEPDTQEGVRDRIFEPRTLLIAAVIAGAAFMASATDVVPRLRGVGGGRDAVPGGVGVWVVEHVTGPFASVDGQDEPGAGADIADGDPGPAVGR